MSVWLVIEVHNHNYNGVHHKSGDNASHVPQIEERQHAHKGEQSAHSRYNSHTLEFAGTFENGYFAIRYRRGKNHGSKQSDVQSILQAAIECKKTYGRRQKHAHKRAQKRRP